MSSLIPTIEHTHPDFLVVYKPAGVHFHSQDGNAGLVAKLEAQLGESLYPVHRLDTPTSGLVVLARHPAAAATLTEQFTAHQVEKRYLALSTQKPKKKQGTIKGGMAKARRGAWKLTQERENFAITQFISHSLRPGVRAFLLRPRSGRTHQIRVALKSLGAPILGDALYGGDEADRTYLHAWSLGFDWQGEWQQFWLSPRQGEVWGEELAPLLSQWQSNDPDWPQN
ncbi:TIGR01621 family pseudouridine synthase [Ferrimonas balearica]|uniref:TIGR01621 family pseudouridine synthase n=1 Tax=Ferrimonas balearica TaxID=44012 RepID=UPI001C99470C|nr:TIGR01621 family pseudouridine synthase [Ferrimonas balearica]MBY5922747.1 TIGR01621 family pseudouridine synthase [Ferrimonas balearica]MBY5995731.1 TIGR01621 family pseudouridine synthase [Ferrimonas balearica]